MRSGSLADQRPAVADSTQCLDGRPARLRIVEGRDQGIDRGIILEPTESVGGGDPEPPVGVLEKTDGGRYDARVIEGTGDHEGEGADLLVGIG